MTRRAYRRGMHTFEAALRRFRAELSAALGLTLAACGPGVPAITTAAPMTGTDASTGSDVPTTSTSAGSTGPDGPGATSMATSGPSSDGVLTTSHASSTGAAPASSSDTGSSDTSSSDTSSSDTGSSDMRSHGRLAPDERARLDREGHRDLIRPCAEALLASVDAQAAKDPSALPHHATCPFGKVSASVQSSPVWRVSGV